MYLIIGGNPLQMYTGTNTFTSLRLVGKTNSFEEMERIFKDNWDDCSGLILVLFNGEELGRNDNGDFIKMD